MDRREVLERDANHSALRALQYTDPDSRRFTIGRATRSTWPVGGVALDHPRSLPDCKCHRGDPLVLDAGSFARLYQRAPPINGCWKDLFFQRPASRFTDDRCRQHLAAYGIRGSAVLHRYAGYPAQPVRSGSNRGSRALEKLLEYYAPFAPPDFGLCSSDEHNRFISDF